MVLNICEQPECYDLPTVSPDIVTGLTHSYPLSLKGKRVFYFPRVVIFSSTSEDVEGTIAPYILF